MIVVKIILLGSPFRDAGTEKKEGKKMAHPITLYTRRSKTSALAKHFGRSSGFHNVTFAQYRSREGRSRRMPRDIRYDTEARDKRTAAKKETMRSRGLLPVDALSRRSNSTRLHARGSRRHTDDLRGIRCIVNKVCQYLGYRVGIVCSSPISAI